MTDMWKAYAEKILNSDPTMYSRREPNYSAVPHYYIYKPSVGGVIDVMDYKTFKHIVNTYFTMAKDVIIQGEALSLGYGLGNIEARRIERNFKHNSIDWGATMAQPKGPNGKVEKYIYHTGDDYCRISWGKLADHQACPNSKNYCFKPTPDDSTGKGFIPEFYDALNKDVTLKFKYKYYPYA